MRIEESQGSNGGQKPRAAGEIGADRRADFSAKSATIAARRARPNPPSAAGGQ